MNVVANKMLVFFLADNQNRTYDYTGGAVTKSSIPTRLKNNPDGWKDMTLQFATNAKYFSTLRAFTTAIKFVKDAKMILANLMFNGKGTEEEVYLIILSSDPTMGINGYRLEYKSRLDLSTFNGDTRTGISLNTLQDDVFALWQANENAVYSLQCNSSNPKAVRILFDGTLLQDKFNYKTIDTIFDSTLNSWYTVPLAFINNEGDNEGIVNNSQNFDSFSDPHAYIIDPTNENFIMDSVDPISVHIKGSIVIDVAFVGGPSFVGLFAIEFATNLKPFPPPGDLILISTTSLLAEGKQTIPVDMILDLAPGEKPYMLIAVQQVVGGHSYTVHLESTDLAFLFASKNDPTVAYGLRYIDVLKQLVAQVTNGRFTADSKFLTVNNKKVLISGSSLRSFPDAVIQITPADFFQECKVAYNIGITVRNGVLYFEPITDLYNSTTELLNLGDVSKASISVAKEYIYASAKVGYQKQQYNQRNGRYEFNCTHNYKFPIYTILTELNLVSPVRGDSFGAEFIRTLYPNLNSTDDKGDADIWGIFISDSVGSAEGEISTAVSFTVETLVLASPVIKSPFTNNVVYFNNPTIIGVAQPNMIITVFVDGFIDGTTIADSDGNWTYEIATSLQPVSDTFNGVHTIEATAQTDPTNISGISNVLTLTINTEAQSPFLITSPGNNDSIFNNLPIISGIAPPGKVITISIDSIPLVNVVANTSGIWSYQTVVPLADGIRVIGAITPGLTDPSPILIVVNKNVTSPVITSINYNDVIYNNLPLIKGVAIPGTVVPVYLDGGGGPIVGGVAGPMGTAVADANGDWSFQVVSVEDSSSNITLYIPDGLHVVSTTPTPINVEASISGYRLMRGTDGGPVMDFDAIRLDDQYIPIGSDPSTLPPTLGEFLHPETIYNVFASPLRILLTHFPELKSMLIQQPDSQIMFNGAEVNANLVTKKNGVTLYEGQNVNASDLGPNLFIPYYLNCDAIVPKTFNQLMSSINNTGYITAIFKDVPIYCLPIGTMKMQPATNKAQTWKLLISGKTPFASLIALFGNGLPIQIGKKMVYISDKNPLHFVRYNYTPPAGYHFADIYDDWQKNRFSRWPLYDRPDYSQPVQKGKDKIPLQFISNGVGELQIQMISVETGSIIDTFVFAPVVGFPVTVPNILQEIPEIDPDGYPEGQYWFAAIADGAIFAITEKIWIKEDWPKTLLHEYGGSSDEIDYFFSTGIKPMIRVQAEFLLWDADSEVDNYEDENGDFTITRGIPINARPIQYGSEEALLSDSMSRKMNQITLLDNLLIEGSHYTRNNNSKWEPQDLGKGIPELLVKIVMTLAENQTGNAFETAGDSGIDSVTWTYDAVAFGHNEGVINVTEETT